MSVQIPFFNITNENNSFSIFIPGHYETQVAEKTIDDLNKLLELKSLELHVQEVRKKRKIIIQGDKDFELSDFDIQKNEILQELRNVKYNDLDYLVQRMKLTYDEIIDVSRLKYIPSKRTRYSLNLGIHEVVDLNNTLKYILPDNVKVNITIDDVRLKSNFKNNQTLIFTIKSFFYAIVGYTQSHQVPLNDIEVFYQILPGSYKSDKPINITAIDEFHLKCDCI